MERLATAFYVRKSSPGASAAERSTSLVQLKPHITPTDALAATEVIATS